MAVVSSRLAYKHPLMHGDQFICPQFLERRHSCGRGSKLNFPAFILNVFLGRRHGCGVAPDGSNCSLSWAKHK